jgi:LytS/YehU family sensor histidine kinase
MMGALGNALFIISSLMGQIAPNVALDFSLLTILLAGIYAGPKAGFATGLIAGIAPGISLGLIGGAAIGLIAIPIGKGLTGLTIGLLATHFKLHNNPRKSLLSIPLTLLSYIPEGIYTYTYLTLLVPTFFPASATPAFIVPMIMIKAVAEVIIMSFMIAAIIDNKAVNNFITTYFNPIKPKNYTNIKQ